MEILLDIDGVMLKAESWRIPDVSPDGFSTFNPISVKSLNSIIEASINPKIIITSSHKANIDKSSWEVLLKNRGVITCPIEIMPTDKECNSRKEEIEYWFNNRSPDNKEPFVILDDDSSLHGLPKHIKDKTIITSSYIGLNQENANMAINILKG